MKDETFKYLLSSIFYVGLCFIFNVQASEIFSLRHIRSKGRHTNERNKILWGLQAFDNLSLNFDFLNATNESDFNQTSFSISTSELFNIDFSVEKEYEYANQTTEESRRAQLSKYKNVSSLDMENILPAHNWPNEGNESQADNSTKSSNLNKTILKDIFINIIKIHSQEDPNQNDEGDAHSKGYWAQLASLYNANEFKEIPKNINSKNGIELTNMSFKKSSNEESHRKASDEKKETNHYYLIKGNDVLTEHLKIIETQNSLDSKCTAGTALYLTEGVVDNYAHSRFSVAAKVAVNRANMLTRIFKLSTPDEHVSENLLHASVISMVEFDDDIFAAGNCFDMNQHPLKRGLYCPFAYRLPPPDAGATFAKDLASEYHYLGNSSEWFYLARKNAKKIIEKNEQYIKAYHHYTNSSVRESHDILAVTYEDGRWSKPYFDCGGGNIWMLTYTVPFFGYLNGTYFFKGTSGIDIDLRRVDIDQCPHKNTTGDSKPPNIFAGTDKCKHETTECVSIPRQGFRRGSYKCVCRAGFYFPGINITQDYYNGTTLEEEYEKLMQNEPSNYSLPVTFICLPCSEGCEVCTDGSPCVAALNWTMRASILVLAIIVIALLPPAAYFTYRYQHVKVLRAASPTLLRVIALGAFCIYCTTIFMYFRPSIFTCTCRIWFREIGFSITYGALMLKTWRISVIFQVKSAKAVKITDGAIMKRLGILCACVCMLLTLRTIVSPPYVIVRRTADDLKAFMCKSDWWDHLFTSMEVLFLAWGVRLCIMVRKAPTEFNESKFISMAIYNEFFLTCFLKISMLFLQSPANPDLLFIICFCHTQLTVTFLLALIFGSKLYIVIRNGDKQGNDSINMGTAPAGAKYVSRSHAKTYTNQSSSSTAQVGFDTDSILTDDDAIQQIRLLCAQLQSLQDRASLRDIATSTIAQLIQFGSTAPPINSLNTHDTCHKSTNTSGIVSCEQCFIDSKETNKAIFKDTIIDEETNEIEVIQTNVNEANDIKKIECAVVCVVTNQDKNLTDQGGAVVPDDNDGISCPIDQSSKEGEKPNNNSDNKVSKLVLNLSDRTKFTKEVSV